MFQAHFFTILVIKTLTLAYFDFHFIFVLVRFPSQVRSCKSSTTRCGVAATLLMANGKALGSITSLSSDIFNHDRIQDMKEVR